MFENKYSKFLTVLIIIIVVALVGLIGYLIYDYFREVNVDANASNALKEWESNIDTSDKEQATANFNFGDSDLSGTSTATITQYEGYNVMGKIAIPKTNIEYPVLEKVTKRSIEIAIAILYTTGDGLNQLGNTVLVGHNYRNGTFFSDNYKLSNGDIIKITDNSGTTIDYEIYDMFETTPEDTEFMTRDTEGRREISLSTCTDDVQQRLIVLAREKQ